MQNSAWSHLNTVVPVRRDDGVDYSSFYIQNSALYIRNSACLMQNSHERLHLHTKFIMFNAKFTSRGNRERGHTLRSG